MNDSYNLFFYPNACHVCKVFGQNIKLKRCSGCKMISYCSKDHQKCHWPQHKDLCRTVQKVLHNNDVSSLFDGMECANKNIWSQIKMNFMLKVRIQIDRCLTPVEKQIFHFLRSCTICCSTKELEDCQSCPNASFCKKHKNYREHNKICQLFKLCFDLDIAFMRFNYHAPKITLPIINSHKLHFPKDMNSFLELYDNAFTNPFKSYQENWAYISEYLTRPLTLLYALEKLNLSLHNEIVVHIIGANMIELDTLKFWEIVFFFLPTLKLLKLVLIGLEIPDDIILDISNLSSTDDKKLDVQGYHMLYEEYMNSKWYLKADVIIGFNAGIHECINVDSEADTWSSSIRAIAEKNYSLVLTSYNFEEAQKEHERMKIILKTDIPYTYFSKNPYSSLRPYRDFEISSVYYQNQYLIIYQYFNITCK